MSAEETPKVCNDAFPHLREDFDTCHKHCIKTAGHRPATPHRCDDGHEWFIDAEEFFRGPQPRQT